MLPRGLFGRSLLIVLIPLLALQAVSAFVFYNRHWDDVGRRLALSLAGALSRSRARLSRNSCEKEPRVFATLRWPYMPRTARR